LFSRILGIALILESFHRHAILVYRFSYHTPHISFRSYATRCHFDPFPRSTIQIARAKEIKAHFQQKQAHEGADARKAAERRATGAIVSLGLVEEGGDDAGSKQ
jgi:hypothetical protein